VNLVLKLAETILSTSHVFYVSSLFRRFLSNTDNLVVNRDMVTATAVVAGLGSMAFGFFTNLPVAIG